MMSKTNSITPKALNWDGADAVASDLLYGEIGYGVNGERLVGEGANWQYVKRLQSTFIDNAVISGDVKIYAPSALILGRAFQGCSKITTLEITFLGCFGNDTGAFYSFFSGMTNLTRLTLYGDTSAAQDWRYIFTNTNNLSIIDGDPLNLTAATWVINITPSSLTEIRIVPSTMLKNHTFANSPLLSTASLLSIANGLDAASAPKTLTMHATAKTNMDNINVDVVDGVAILGTTKTLTQFIATDKGWTIA